MLKIQLFALLTITLLVWSTFSESQTHVHGEGQLLIAQDGNTWQMEFIIPAADILGFENKTNDVKKVKRVNEIAKLISDASNLITIPNNCQASNISHNLMQFIDSNDGVHKNHEHAKLNASYFQVVHDKHDHNHSGHHQHHSDVTITLLLNCVSGVSQLELKIFEITPSIDKFNAQWILENQQGAKSISRPQAILIFA